MILGIETSTRNCSLILIESDGTYCLKEQCEESHVHAEMVHSQIQQWMEEGKLNLSRLKGVVVGRGPGSYTGLRIGTACAKGLCYALNLPLYSVSTLDMMVQAEGPRSNDRTVFAVIDARRTEVFGCYYNGELEPIGTPTATVVDENTWVNTPDDLVILGENASKLRPFGLENFTYLDVYPSAKAFALESVQALYRKENLAYFEPEYIKDFVPTVARQKV
jgi:tRNA threonylcarbamoyladenosine biosynthesis protein TsaB